MREQPTIPEECLYACLREQYGLIARSLNFLAQGLDYRAGVYRVVSEQGTSYLLKVKSGALYAPAYLIPGYLKAQGITAVVAPLPTLKMALWASIDSWTVIVYPFIEGDTSWSGVTDEQWQEVGGIFKQIHQVAPQAIPPSFGVEALRQETFDPTEYARWIRAFEIQYVRRSTGRSEAKRTLRSSWSAHQLAIHTSITAMEALAQVLQKQTLPHVICHADLHPGNLLRASADHHVFVIDWDEVMLAPKEHDFLFVNEAPRDDPAPDATRSSIPPFFQGYGPTEIDWTALTYYHFERVVQDVIECSKHVFFRNDLAEESKLDAVQLFDTVLTQGGEIDAAISAATHLPAHLTLRT